MYLLLFVKEAAFQIDDFAEKIENGVNTNSDASRNLWPALKFRLQKYE